MLLVLVICYLTLHRFIIERHHNIVNVSSAGAECYVEPGSPERLHPGGDVNTGGRSHQDLQVTLAGLASVNYRDIRVISTLDKPDSLTSLTCHRGSDNCNHLPLSSHHPVSAGFAALLHANYY